MLKSELGNALQAFATAKKNELLALDRARLFALPESDTESLCTALGKVTMAVYHTVSDAGEMFVAQATTPRAFGIFNAIEINGFVIDKNGQTRPLTERETWDYI